MEITKQEKAGLGSTEPTEPCTLCENTLRITNLKLVPLDRAKRKLNNPSPIQYFQLKDGIRIIPNL